MVTAVSPENGVPNSLAEVAFDLTPTSSAQIKLADFRYGPISRMSMRRSTSSSRWSRPGDEQRRPRPEHELRLQMDRRIRTGDEPLQKLGFEDTKLDFGKVMSDLLGPIFDRINSVLEPIRPIIDLLKMPIPVINDLPAVAISQLNRLDSPEVQLIDLVALYFRRSGRFSRSSTPSIRSAPLVGDGGSGELDPRQFPTCSPPNQADRTDVDPQQAGFGLSQYSFDDKLIDLNVTGETGNDPFLSKASILPRKTRWTTAGLRDEIQLGRGLVFPILQNPTLAFQLLLGRDVDLVI